MEATPRACCEARAPGRARPPALALALARAIGAALTLAGCAERVLVFDESGALGAEPRAYALGSSLELRVLGPAGAAPDVVLAAGEPSAMALRDDGGGRYRLELLREGRTSLRVIDAADPAHVLTAHPVDVARPARARILAHAEDAAGETDDGRDVRAIADGELRVRLALFAADGRALLGEGGVALVATPALVLEGDEGTHQILFLPGVAHVDVEARDPRGALLGRRGVELVTPQAVASIELREGRPAPAFDGERRRAVARARDGDGAPLLGARFSWTLDGVGSARFDDVIPLIPGADGVEVTASYGGRSVAAYLAQ